MKIVQDYFLDHYSYISEERMKRPQYLVAEETLIHPDDCVFCPGNEALTPEEIGRIDDGSGGWKMRWFPNKFPAVTPEDPAAYGYQEIIVTTPDPTRQFWDFTEEEISQLFGICQHRVQELSKDQRIKYVVIFKNHGFESASSIIHSHSQLLATSVLPTRVSQKVRAIEKIGYCPYCSILEEERNSERFVFENHDFMVFCPRAPRFAMEAWIIAKSHRGDFAQFPKEMIANLSEALRSLLPWLKEVNASYCFYPYYGTNDNELHFHLELLPRIQKWGGFELASGDYIIGIPPEHAARFYREGERG